MPAHEHLSLPDRIAVFARRALLGQLPAPLRAYSFDFDETSKRITLRAEVDRELTEDEREDFAVAETEIYAACIFGDDTLIKTVVEVVPLDQPLCPLPGGMAYLREGEQAAAA